MPLKIRQHQKTKTNKTCSKGEEQLMKMKELFARVKERIADRFKPPSQEEILSIFSTIHFYKPPTEEERRQLMEYIESLENPKED